MNVLLELLRDAASRAAQPHAERNVRWHRIGERERRHVLQAGLGPWLLWAAGDGFERMPVPLREALLGADLAERVRHGNRVETVVEVVDLCHAMGIEVTLLKGIAVSEQLYPAAHLRPMGDVDLLVNTHDRDRLQQALLQRGYLPARGAQPTGMHHARALCHPRFRAWVEVHSALFPARSELLGNSLFTPREVAARSTDTSFQGRRVRRLDDELQLVYTAAYWIRDLSRHAPHPSFVVPLLDAVLLLADPTRTIRIAPMAEWVDNEMASASLSVLLACIDRLGVVPRERLDADAIARRQARIGSLERNVIRGYVYGCVVRGVPLPGQWRIASVLHALMRSGSPAGKLLSLPYRLLFPPTLPP